MAVTPNLGLHQWQPGDSFLRTDFNEDFAKLDTAVGDGLKCTSGSFVGNDIYPRKVTLPRRPKLIFLQGVYHYVQNNYLAQLFCAEGMFLLLANGQKSDEVVELLDDGFQITTPGYFNDSGRTARYFCLY